MRNRARRASGSCYSLAVTDDPDNTTVHGPHVDGDDATSVQMSGAARRFEGTPTVAGYDLVRVLGRGGMGVVFEALEHRFDRTVALKVRNAGGDPAHEDDLRREAHLAAKIGDPGIVRVHDVGLTLDGQPYYTMDLVDGTDLKTVLMDGPLTQARAIAIGLDVSSAVAAAHEVGITHRDLKPRNIIIDTKERARVLDFGIAHSEASGPDIYEGKPVGSPGYMAPEQVRGEPPAPGVDVHAIGLLLFEMITGTRAFDGPTTQTMFYNVLMQPAPTLRSRTPSAHADLEAVVAKCLAKDPAARFRSGRAVFEALSAIAEGKPVDQLVGIERARYVPRSVSTTPPSPRPRRADAKKHFRWSWHLASPPEKLWPHVANTDRFNKAIGLSKVDFVDAASAEEPARPVRTGRMRAMGVGVEWREYPFEWVKEREHSVYRAYSAGPISALWNRVTLAPRDGGTELVHEVSVVPRGVLGEIAAFVEINQRAARNMDRSYRRLDEVLQRGTDEDPFEPPHAPEGDAIDAVHRGIERLGRECGFGADILARLTRLLLFSPDQVLATLRPFALADAWGTDRAETLDLFIHAHGVGLLEPQWDVVCPTCRVAHETLGALGELRRTGKCQGCLDTFERDLAEGVELVFGPAERIRRTERETYCKGAPALRPHVLMQQILDPFETRTVTVDLPRGNYRVVGADGLVSAELVSSAMGYEPRCDAVLGEASLDLYPAMVAAGPVTLILRNDTDREETLRVEIPGARTDGVTAAHALTHPTFRDVRPGDLLAKGEHVSVGRMTFVFLEIADRDALFEKIGDGPTCERLARLEELLAAEARKETGQVVSGTLATDALHAAFTSTLPAVRAALAVARGAGTAAPDVVVRIAVHEGRCLALTRGDAVEYFGQTLHRGIALLRDAPPGGLALSTAVSAERAVMVMMVEGGHLVRVQESSDVAYGGRRVTTVRLAGTGIPGRETRRGIG